MLSLRDGTLAREKEGASTDVTGDPKAGHTTSFYQQAQCDAGTLVILISENYHNTFFEIK